VYHWSSQNLQGRAIPARRARRPLGDTAKGSAQSGSAAAVAVVQVHVVVLIAGVVADLVLAVLVDGGVGALASIVVPAASFAWLGDAKKHRWDRDGVVDESVGPVAETVVDGSVGLVAAGTVAAGLVAAGTVAAGLAVAVVVAGLAAGNGDEELLGLVGGAANPEDRSGCRAVVAGSL